MGRGTRRHRASSLLSYCLHGVVVVFSPLGRLDGRVRRGPVFFLCCCRQVGGMSRGLIRRRRPLGNSRREFCVRPYERGWNNREPQVGGHADGLGRGALARAFGLSEGHLSTGKPSQLLLTWTLFPEPGGNSIYTEPRRMLGRNSVCPGGRWAVETDPQAWGLGSCRRPFLLLPCLASVVRSPPDPVPSVTPSRL